VKNWTKIVPQSRPRSESLSILSVIMRTLFITVTFLCAALAQNSTQLPPPAQAFVPATSQTFSLDLDTAEGAFSQWRHDDLGSLSAMRATIHVPRLGRDPRWAPTFSLWLQHIEGGQARNGIALQLLAPTRKPPLVVRVVQVEDGKLVSTESLSRTIDLNESLVVEMVWGTPHMVTIKIGDAEVHKASIPWSIDSVGVSASTGQLKVDPLVLGSLGK
jgi:hypothetical protein